MERTIGAGGSPMTRPLLRAVMVLGVIVTTAIHSPQDAGMSLALIAVGVPVYYAWRAWQRGAA